MNTEPEAAPEQQQQGELEDGALMADQAEPVDSTADELPDEQPSPAAPAGATPAEAEASKPSEDDIAVHTGTGLEPGYELARAMDRADEIMIIDEIQGRALETFVYSFTGSDGKPMTDLSVVGVGEAVRLLNERGGHRIRISPAQPITNEISEGEETYVQVQVYAEDVATGAGAWGTAVEPKHMRPSRGKNAGKVIWDKFAATKALNKAERNAKKKLIPEEARQTIIAMFLKDEGRVKRLQVKAGVDTRAEEISDLPPPPEGDRAETLRGHIHELYDELKGVNRMALPPVRFQGYYQRSNVSVEELERMENYLLELIETEREKIKAEEKAKAEADKKKKAAAAKKKQGSDS